MLSIIKRCRIGLAKGQIPPGLQVAPITECGDEEFVLLAVYVVATDFSYAVARYGLADRRTANGNVEESFRAEQQRLRNSALLRYTTWSIKVPGFSHLGPAKTRILSVWLPVGAN